MELFHLKKLQEIQQKLLEIKYKDVKSSFFDTVDNNLVIQKVIEAIETLPQDKRGIYLQWLLNLYESESDKFIDNINIIVKSIKPYYKSVEKGISNIPSNFLNEITTMDKFLDVMKKVFDIKQKQETLQQQEKDIIVLYENDNWLGLIPNSKEAAIKYGKGTTWCTSGIRKNDFDRHNQRGLLVYLVNKKIEHGNVAMYLSFHDVTTISFLNSHNRDITENRAKEIIGESFFDKVIEKFWYFFYNSPDKRTVFGRKLKKAYNFISQNKEVPKEILMFKNNINNSVAQYCAEFKKTWSTNDKEILMQKDNRGNSVAHLLASQNPEWTTQDKDILNLRNKFNQSVKSVLEQKGKI